MQMETMHGATIKESVFVNNCSLGAQIFTRYRKESCNDTYESELSFEYLHVYLVSVFIFCAAAENPAVAVQAAAMRKSTSHSNTK